MDHSLPLIDQVPFGILLSIFACFLPHSWLFLQIHYLSRVEGWAEESRAISFGSGEDLMADDRFMCKNAHQELSQVFIACYGVWEWNSVLLFNLHGWCVWKVLCSRQFSTIPECTTTNPLHGPRTLSIPSMSGWVDQGEESHADENEDQRVYRHLYIRNKAPAPPQSIAFVPVTLSWRTVRVWTWNSSQTHNSSVFNFSDSPGWFNYSSVPS